MPPFFIVENEAFVRPAAERHVAFGKHQPIRWHGQLSDSLPGIRIGQILKSHLPGFDVHQFMNQAQLGKVSQPRVEFIVQTGRYGGGHPFGIRVDRGRFQQR